VRADGNFVEWRSIPGWPEYEISEFGTVRRVGPASGAKRGRILRPWRNPRTGYLQIGLWKGGKDTRFTVHRLVALTFLGEPPTPAHLVAHDDGTRDNNHWSNLRWATQRENMADTVRHGTHNRGRQNGQARIDEVCVRAIRKMDLMGIPRRVAADGFGLCRQSIDDIVNRKRWEHFQ
jgi:hypothetical protein